MGQKKSVGIWIRVSTEDQARGESPEHHEKRARLYAEGKGWQVAEVYHLEALSGKSVMGYPQTKKMLEDVRKGKITGLIFSKLARLARNTKELLEFAEIFRDKEVDLISLQEAIDTSTPAGRHFYTMIAANAQWEREEISERISASVPIRAKMGKNLGGQAPYGYRWIDKGKKLEIDENEAPIRKLMFELFLKYKRKKAVARELNEQGFRTRNGSEFSGPTVDRLLRDTMAKGQRRTNHTKSVGNGSKRVPKSSTEWVILSCPAIVDEDIWNECNRILLEQVKKNKKVGPRPKSLLAGLVYCTCDRKMYVFHQTNSPTYQCRVCKTRITVEDLDEIFREQLKFFLQTDVNLSDYLQKVDTGLQEKEALIEVLQNERVVIKKKMDGLIELRINNELTKEVFAEHYKPLEDRLLQIDGQLPDLEAHVDFLKIQHHSSNEILREAKDLNSKWSKLPFDEKRSIAEIITERITVGREDIHIKLSYVPSKISNTSSNTTTNTNIPSSLSPDSQEKAKPNEPLSPNRGNKEHKHLIIGALHLFGFMKGNRHNQIYGAVVNRMI